MNDEIKQYGVKEVIAMNPLLRDGFRPRRARILDPDFEYVPAAATDVQRTWRRFGWVPMAEQSCKP